MSTQRDAWEDFREAVATVARIRHEQQTPIERADDWCREVLEGIVGLFLSTQHIILLSVLFTIAFGAIALAIWAVLQ